MSSDISRQAARICGRWKPPAAAPVRICVFGAPTDRHGWPGSRKRCRQPRRWLCSMRMRRRVRTMCRAALQAAVAAVSRRRSDPAARRHDAAAVLVRASAACAGDAGRARRVAARQCRSGTLAAAGIGAAAMRDVAVIDALCYSHSRHQVIDWPTFSPLLSAWHGARLQARPRAFAQRARAGSICATARCAARSSVRGRSLRALARATGAGTRQRSAATLSARRAARTVGAALASDAADSAISLPRYPGLDAQAGRAARAARLGRRCRTFRARSRRADSERHHLVLDGARQFPTPLLRRGAGTARRQRCRTRRCGASCLPNPIRSTALTPPHLCRVSVVEVAARFRRRRRSWFPR